MFRKILLVVILSVVAGPALAQTDVFPPLVAGEYTFKVHSAAVELDANGVPVVVATRSVGLFVVDVPADLLTCVDMGPDEIAPVTVTLTAGGDRSEVKARAYEGTSCGGRASDDSTNSAFMYFAGPATPDIVE